MRSILWSRKLSCTLLNTASLASDIDRKSVGICFSTYLRVPLKLALLRPRTLSPKTSSRAGPCFRSACSESLCSERSQPLSRTMAPHLLAPSRTKPGASDSLASSRLRILALISALGELVGTDLTVLLLSPMKLESGCLTTIELSSSRSALSVPVPFSVSSADALRLFRTRIPSKL